MFVVTIGPLSKYFGKMVRILAVGVALLLILMIIWKMTGSTEVPQTECSSLGEELVTSGRQFGAGLMQHFFTSLRQWFRFGF